MLTAHDRQHVSAQLAAVVAPVTLHCYSQTFGCDACPDTMRLLRELTELSPAVSLEEKNLVLDKEAATQDTVELAPTVVISSGDNRRIRFVGGPFGYEFASLLHAVVLVSSGESGLSQASRDRLAALREPVTIRVFSTPT